MHRILVLLRSDSDIKQLCFLKDFCTFIKKCPINSEPHLHDRLLIKRVTFYCTLVSFWNVQLIFALFLGTVNLPAKYHSDHQIKYLLLFENANFGFLAFPAHCSKIYSKQIVRKNAFCINYELEALLLIYLV